jgi:RNA polymerase sporulation-specific sigma factor
MFNNQKQDLELIRRIRLGDTTASETMVKKYMPMVRHIVNRYYTKNSDFEDLIQEGLIGLLGAINEYKPHAFDVKFSSFAYLCIYRKISNALKQLHGNKQRLLTQAYSLYQYINSDENLTLMDCLQDDWSNPAEEIIEELYSAEIEKYLQKHLSFLEYTVTQLLSKGYTAREIYRDFGVDPKRVDNARTRVKSKLKRVIAQYGDLDMAMQL